MPAEAALVLERGGHQPLHLALVGDRRELQRRDAQPAAVLSPVGRVEPKRGLLVGPAVLGLRVAGADAVVDLIEPREGVELLGAGHDHVVVGEGEDRRARRAGAHDPSAGRLGELALAGIEQLVDHVGRLGLVLERDLDPCAILRLDALGARSVGVALVHRREPGGYGQVALVDVGAAPEMRVGDRIAQAEHDVVDLDDRVLVGRVAEAAPGRRIVPALRARAADARVPAGVVEASTVQLEQHLRHAAVDLRAEAGRDDGVGDASADHVGFPGPHRVVAELVPQVRARRWSGCRRRT